MFKTILKSFDIPSDGPNMNTSLQTYMQVKKVKSDDNLLRTKLVFSSSIKCLSYGPKESNLENFSPEVNLLNGEKMLVI